MALTTFAELKSSIADFLNRDDLTSVIPDFITLAEADMNRNVRHWRQEARTSQTIDAQYEDLPSDFLEAVRYYVTSSDTNSLELISQGEMLERRERSLNTTGRPQYYAITAGQAEFYPTPDGTYTAELYYVQRITALSDSNTSNWVLQYYPDAYLYGALVHSAPYLAEDNRTAVWSSLYQNAINAINMESEKAKFGGSGRRMKIRSY